MYLTNIVVIKYKMLVSCYSHDPVVLTKHIEKLLSRINKCEHDIHMLLGKEVSIIYVVNKR